MKIETKFNVGQEVKISYGYIGKGLIRLIEVHDCQIYYVIGNMRYTEKALSVPPKTLEVTDDEILYLEYALRNNANEEITDFYRKLKDIIKKDYDLKQKRVSDEN